MYEAFDKNTFDNSNEYTIALKDNELQSNKNNEYNNLFNSNTDFNINIIEESNNIEQDKIRQEECTALVTVKESKLMVAQNMFKKSIKFSIKTFLISLSLSFLNLFI